MSATGYFDRVAEDWCLAPMPASRSMSCVRGWGPNAAGNEELSGRVSEVEAVFCRVATVAESMVTDLGGGGFPYRGSTPCVTSSVQSIEGQKHGAFLFPWPCRQPCV